MILVDSSVWIDHLRKSDAALEELLGKGQVLSHPFVVGELALGSLRDRALVIGALKQLPHAVMAEDEEVLVLIERHALFGLGLGYIDTHLLASTLLTPGTMIWTRDRRLRESAKSLSVAAALA